MCDTADKIYGSEWINIDGNEIHRTALIHPSVKLGKGNKIYPYAVIGYVGFVRYAVKDSKVSIGDNNTIGVHSCIMHNTKIGDGNRIMNLVNIGHDCVIQNDNEIGAHSMICGHVTIGSKNMIKVQCNLRNRIVIGDANFIAMGSNVVKDLGSGKTVKGNPAR